MVVAAVAALLVLPGQARAHYDHVRTYDNVVVARNAGPVVLGAGNADTAVAAFPVITYYATRNAGFVGRGSYVIRVDGAEGTTVYRSSKRCAPIGAIEYGDRVQVRVDAGFVAAGSRHHC